jgi:hypothetical protein
LGEAIDKNGDCTTIIFLSILLLKKMIMIKQKMIRKTIYCALLLIISFGVKAQEQLNIKQQTVLQYTISVNGQSFPMFFNIDSLSENNVTLSWSFENGRSGKFIMTKASIDSASFAYFNRPNDGEELVLPGTHGLLSFSKKLYGDLQKNKKATFDNAVITVQPSLPGNTFKLNGKTIDALYAESESGAKIWILNNASYPLILKMENNPNGVDAELTMIQ